MANKWDPNGRELISIILCRATDKFKKEDETKNIVYCLKVVDS